MIKGVIAGNFDVIHPGYIEMFNTMVTKCDHLTVLLHTDPSIERPSKLKPILTVDERVKILKSLIYVNDIHTYTLESELLGLLHDGEYDIRFLGDDYINKPFTGDDLKIPIHYLNRDHGWSTTKFKRLISESYEKVNNS